MPNYKKHIAGGLITYLTLLYCLTKFDTSLLQSSIQLLGSCIFGSLFPDIDTKSKIQKIFYIFVMILFGFLVFSKQDILFVIFTFLSLVPLVVNHRGIFHRVWFALLLGFSTSLITSIYFKSYLYIVLPNIIFFTFGVFSHLFLDIGIKKLLK